MNEVGFRREIFDFLKTGYGITDAMIEGGGKHNALVFTKPNGPCIKTTWPRGPIGGLDWPRTLEIKRKDLINMLGEPAAPPPKPRTRMEDLMPAPKELPVEVALADQIREKLPSLAAQLAPPSPEIKEIAGCRISCYGYPNKNGLYLRLIVLNEYSKLVKDRIRITKVAPDVWSFESVPEAGLVALRYGSGKTLIQWRFQEQGEPFGYTPCSAWTENGILFARMPAPEARVQLAARSTKVRVPQAKSPELPKTASGAQWVEPITPPTADDIRACLVTIRRIEAETPYRLVRDGDAWVFDPGLARIV